jgi:hypothetical protein
MARIRVEEINVMTIAALETGVLAVDTVDRSRVASFRGRLPQSLSPDVEQPIFLVMDGQTERVLLTEKPSVVMGRADKRTGFQPDVDLTSHGALVRGISRAHARLYRHGSHLYVADLSSANGTYVGGIRLTPDIPYRLRSGDELTLGCLNIRVLFS